MIKCELTGRGLGIDAKTRNYVEAKIGGLEKYLPKKMRETALFNVILMDDPNGREDNRYVCEAVLTIQGDTLVSREGTVNVFAAIDIVEAKLKLQLGRYKEKHVSEPRRARMLAKLTGRKTETAEI